MRRTTCGMVLASGSPRRASSSPVGTKRGGGVVSVVELRHERRGERRCERRGEHWLGGVGTAACARARRATHRRHAVWRRAPYVTRGRSRPCPSTRRARAPVGMGQGQGAVVSARLLGRACKACMQGLPFVQGAVVSARTRALVSSSLRSVEVLAFPGARDGAMARNTSASSSSSSAAASASSSAASSSAAFASSAAASIGVASGATSGSAAIPTGPSPSSASSPGSMNSAEDR